MHLNTFRTINFGKAIPKNVAVLAITNVLIVFCCI